MSSDPFAAPRAKNGRAPDVFAPGAWRPMREYAENEPVDFAIVGTGAGGGTLACRLAEKGFSVVAFDAGPFFRPLDEFASDETEQTKLYWNDERVVEGNDPLEMGGNNSGKAVGGSTVHFAMVSLRFRPEWFKVAQHFWLWRGLADRLAGDVGLLRTGGTRAVDLRARGLSLGAKAPRYPYRAHPISAAGEVLARGAEALGYEMDADAARHGLGAAWQIAALRLSRFLPLRLRDQRQAERAHGLDSPRAGGGGRNPRPRHGRPHRDVRARTRSGVHYFREGAWRFQRAGNVVVAGYAVETPRLLLMSANEKFPDGLANSSGLVGKYLMTQPNQAVFGESEDEIRWYKAPPSTAITEHWNYDDRKDFFGGYCWMAQGPLPIEWAGISHRRARPVGRGACAKTCRNTIHAVGVKMVGESMPDENNCVTLDESKDRYGLPVARIRYAWTDNDKKLIAHALRPDGAEPARGGREEHVPAGARTPTISPAPPAWAPTRARAWWTPIAARGTSAISGFATARCSHGWRRQSLAHHPGHRPAHGGPHRGSGAARRALGDVTKRTRRQAPKREKQQKVKTNRRA